MKKYRTSSIYLDKCMRTIEQNCLMNSTGSFHGTDLSVFCSKPKNVYALHLLAASVYRLSLMCYSFVTGTTMPSTKERSF